MENKNNVNDSLEQLTKQYANDFFKYMGDQRNEIGEPINRQAILLAADLGEHTVDFIRNGYTTDISNALAYTLKKINLTIDHNNVAQAKAVFNMLERLKDYNNGETKIKRVFDIYTVTAGDPDGVTYFGEKDISFTEADLLFDSFKGKKEYPVIILDEGNISIRGYGPKNGDEREPRYDVINNLTKKIERLETITYKPIPVQNEYIFHTDHLGHAWLEVPLQEITDLGLKDSITPYSYAANGKAYLEEDIDAGTFLEMRKNINARYEIRDRFFDGDNPIRILAHYENSFITLKKKMERSSEERINQVIPSERGISANKKSKEDFGFER